MATKKVGVIIPCYNHENYVDQAIQSILNQSYQDFDIYAADDASIDRTREKLMLYDEQIKEIHLFDENHGGQVMFLLNRVDNEYTALLNSDDFWHETKLEKQVRYMDEHPECAACFTWCDQVNDAGERVDGIVGFNQTNRTSEEWMRYFYEYGNCLSHPSILIRTHIYKKLLFNVYKAFRQVPDFQMWIKLIQEEKIHIIEEELMSFRWHNSTTSTNISSLTIENIVRHRNEECYLWYETIALMEYRFFIKAFKDLLIYKQTETEEQLKCEKFFVLSQAINPLTRQAAVFYFYDIYKESKVQDCFTNLYNFGKKDFFKLETEIGYGELLMQEQEKKRIMRDMGQCIIDANR